MYYFKGVSEHFGFFGFFFRVLWSTRGCRAVSAVDFRSEGLCFMAWSRLSSLDKKRSFHISLSTQVYKWVTEQNDGGLTLRWTSIPFRSGNTPIQLLSSGRVGHLWFVRDLTFFFYWRPEILRTFNCALNLIPPYLKRKSPSGQW